jgi:lipopolysaccharide cholinephosphotransferase
MNELQQVEFDLFRCFAETCEKLNLPYFLVCGSALGAARHGGFIPWDDDMDVGMYREDYNKFMELAPALLPEGIFLQNYKSDPAFPAVFAKLRNSNTTYVEKPAIKLNINHGIYLDIFPLDGYPSKPSEQRKLVFWKKFYSRQLTCAFIMPPTLKGKLSTSVFRLFGCHKRTAKIAAKCEALISKYPVKDSELICNHGTWYGKRDFIAAKYYGKGTEILYEGYTARVPEDFDGYLTSLYGDWRTPPPPEKQRGHHFYEICDTKKPYTDYLKFK